MTPREAKWEARRTESVCCGNSAVLSLAKNMGNLWQARSSDQMECTSLILPETRRETERRMCLVTKGAI